MKFSRVLMISGILLAGISLACVAKEGKVYTWTDSKGVIHYGEHPPKDVQAKLVKTRTGHSDPTPAQVAASKAQPIQDSQPQQTGKFPDPDRCAKATANLNMLNTVARIKMKNEAGEEVFLTEQDKAKQRKDMELIIQQACE
jgi:hypothetical protein